MMVYMNITDFEFVGHISAKICHDLASSLSALSNAVEFIDVKDLNIRTKAIEIINTSSNQTLDILRLFREIYGAAKYEGEADLLHIKNCCTKLAAHSSLRLDFLVPSTLPKEMLLNVYMGKLLLALFCYVKQKLIHGGNIAVSVNKIDNNNLLKVSISGQDMKIKKDHDSILLGAVVDKISPNNIEPYYIAKLLKTLKASMTISYNNDNIDYIVNYPSIG